MRTYSWFNPLTVTVALIAGLAGGRMLIAGGVVGSEDNLLFYMMGLNLVAADQLSEMADQAIAFYTANGADPHALLRLEFRKTYLNEFPLPGAIYLAIGRTYLELFEASRNLYPLFLAQTIVFGLTAAMALSVIAVVALTRLTGRPWHLWALAATMVLFVLSEFIPVAANSFATLLVNDSVGAVLGHLGQLLVRPGPQFSPLGFTPRSHFALLMIAVFALRWSNRHHLGYALILVLSFVHLSTSALILLTLLAVDVFVRPQIFMQRKVAVITAITTVVVMSRQTMWQLLGDAWPILAVAAAIIVIAAMAIWKAPGLQSALAKPFGWLTPVRRKIVGRNKIAADLRVLALGWIVSFVILYAVIAVFEPFEPLSKFYFWGRLHGRTAMILWPSVIFGLIVLLKIRAARRIGLTKGLRAAVVAGCLLVSALVAVPAVQTVRDGNVLVRVATDFLQADQRLYGDPMRSLPAMGFEEKVLYYGMIKSIDLNEPYLPLVLR